MTPEARRDRATILRHDGVAPAQFLVFSDAIFVLAFSPRFFDSREMRLRQSEEVAISEVQNENLTFFTGKPSRLPVQINSSPSRVSILTVSEAGATP